MFRRLFLLTLLLPVAARAQTPAFAPDFSKPDAAAFVAPYSQNGGVASPVRIEKVAGALKMTATAGGSLGVRFNVPPFDLDQLTRLSFDYTTSPDAKINLFFRVNGRYFAVLFTGPKKVRAGTTIIYDANVSKLAGHVEIPLRAAIRAQMPGEASLRLDEILAGNWDNDGYLLAGIGGNGPGAAWTISNFKIERPDVKPTFGTARFEGDELILPAQNLDAFPWSALQLDSEFIDASSTSYDPARGFVFDLTQNAANKSLSSPPHPLRDGEIVKYQIKAGAGNAVLSEGSATFRFAGLPVPSPPQLTLSQPDDKFLQVDFESPEVPFAMNRTPNTVFERDPINPYNGKWSARLTNRSLASVFDLSGGDLSIDVARHPVLTFAYRCDDRLRLDLNLSWNNQPYSIHFTDSDDPNPRLGDLNAVRDGQWHLAQFNVLDALKKAQPSATDFKITNFMWNDSAWTGNVKGLKWWLDDLKWATNTGGKLQGELSLRDATGTSAISYALDQTPTSPADEKAEGGPKISLDLAGKTGLWWLHARAQNGAGKWSETAHFPVWCG